MAFLAWIGKAILSLLIDKIGGWLIALFRKSEERKADHEKNKNQAAQDTEKLKGIKESKDGKEVDEAIDRSLDHF